MPSKVLLVSFIIPLLLSACASNLNEGASHTTTIPAGSQSLDDPIVRALFFPNSTLNGSSLVIRPGENFSIILVSAFICDFREGGIFSGVFDGSNTGSDKCAGGTKNRSVLSSQERTTRGEIAILADYGSNTDKPAGSTSIEDFGRVVYYNEDIRESGQMLNDIGVRLYGPIKYKNEVSTLKLAVVEFDEAENERTKAIIKRLAAAGGQAYPPATAVLGVLNSLGQVVIDQNKNDVEFRASRIFEPPSATSSVARAPLQEGHYVFVRDENRSAELNWGGLHLCEREGYLGSANCDGPYRQKTWFLIRVSREDADVATVQNVGQELAAFSDASAARLKAEAEDVRQDLIQLNSNISDLLDKSKLCTDAKAKSGTDATNPMVACK